MRERSLAAWIVDADSKHPPTAITAQGKRIGDTRGYDARNVLDTLHNPVIESCLQRGLVPLRTRGYAPGGRPFRAKTQVDFQNVEKTAYQESGANQQHASKRHLGNDKRTLRPCGSFASAPAATRVLQRFRVICTGHLKRGNNAEQNSRYQRNQRREKECCSIDPDGPEQRHADCLD